MKISSSSQVLVVDPINSQYWMVMVMVLIISSNLFFFKYKSKISFNKANKEFFLKYAKQIRRDITTNINALLLTNLTNLAKA